jgi:outer membrane lipoprotein SlyB
MSIKIRPAARMLTLAALAAGTLALAGCAAPYGAGYGDGYGTGYQTGYQTAGYQGAYGNAGYGTGYDNGYQAGYGTSGTQISGAPAYPQQSYPQQSYPQQSYPQQTQQPAYPRQPGYDQYGYPQQAQGSYDGTYGNGAAYNDPYTVRYGWVESIEQVGGQPANASGVGAVLGGVAGGLLGHQIGGGRGNTVATIGGAVAGALAGNEVEKRTHTTPAAFRVRVRTNDNAYMTLTQASPYNLRIGDRVKVQNGTAVPY